MTEPTSARPHQRVSPEEREEAAERIRLAAGEGRLTLEELEERLEAALSARTYGELDALVDDLPTRPGAVPGPPASARLAVSDGHLERVGSWPIPRHLDVELAYASAYLDLRTGQLPPGGMEISLQALMSKIVLTVPDDAVVVVDELGQHSSKVVRRGRRGAAGGRVIRVFGDLRRSKLTVKWPG